MITLKTVSRLGRPATILAAGAALVAISDLASADSGSRAKLIQSVVDNATALPCAETSSGTPPRSRPVAFVSNGMTTASIFNGPGGLELSANAPGTITVTSGSNSVTLHGNAITLSGAIALAQRATPGVNVTPNAQGGYTVVRNTPCNSLVDADPRNEIAGLGQLNNQCPETGDFEDIGNDFDR